MLQYLDVALKHPKRMFDFDNFVGGAKDRQKSDLYWQPHTSCAPPKSFQNQKSFWDSPKHHSNTTVFGFYALTFYYFNKVIE